MNVSGNKKLVELTYVRKCFSIKFKYSEVRNKNIIFFHFNLFC